MRTNKVALGLSKESRLEHAKFKRPKYVSSVGFLWGGQVILFVHGPNIIFSKFTHSVGSSMKEEDKTQ